MPRDASATHSFRAKHAALYASERDCSRYDVALCRCQDHEGNLLRALEQHVGVPLDGRHVVVDVGTGTGKLARLLAPHVRRVDAFDRSEEMVAAARAATGAENVRFAAADVRQVPLPDGCADLVVAGWAVSYLKAEHEVWHADGSSSGPWREEVDAALQEMDRLLVPGGAAVVLETLGTACATPTRSGSHLYAHFRRRGFHEAAVRTDYRFRSRAEALETLLFFFGKGVAARATALLADAPPDAPPDAPCTVPECTLLCWRHKRRTAPAAAAAVGDVRRRRGVRLASALVVVGLVVLAAARARRRH